MLTYELTPNTQDLNKLVEYLSTQFTHDHFYVEHNHLIATMSPNDLNKVFACIRQFEHTKSIL